MMKRTTLITFGLSIAACSSSATSSAPQPASAADYEDTAQTIASSTVTGQGGATGATGAGDIFAMRDALSLVRGRLPIGFALRSDGRFHGDHMGIDNSFMVICKDAAGAVQAKCDQTTDSATVDVKWTGDLKTPNFTASIDREGTWTITGLQGATATFNGSSSFSFDTTMTSIFHQGVTSTDTFDNTASYSAITLTTADHEITGGSASFEVKGHRTVTGTAMGKNDVDKAFDVKAVLTFNADHTATLVLDGTQTFTIDLQTGKLTRA
jgi:hypothetical protein